MELGRFSTRPLSKYEDVFIEVEKRGFFKGSDIDQNGIRVETLVQDFVANFEHELDSKPALAFDVCYLLYLSIFFLTLEGQCRPIPLSTICPLPNLGKPTLGLSRTQPPRMDQPRNRLPKTNLTRKGNGRGAMPSHARWPISWTPLLVNGKNVGPLSP